FQTLAVAINTGTNLPSVATPNGQAAFLFLLTSAIAPLVRLSYGRMVIMALPYTIVMGGVGLYMVTHAF
ncbi:MAG: sodium/proton antiporter, partial [Marinobacter sp.]|nr:sodium/proton antiporter [Marinobacter sp.]